MTGEAERLRFRSYVAWDLPHKTLEVVWVAKECRCRVYGRTGTSPYADWTVLVRACEDHRPLESCSFSAPHEVWRVLEKRGDIVEFGEEEVVQAEADLYEAMIASYHP